MSTVPNRTRLLQKMWSLIQIHPGKLWCLHAADRSVHAQVNCRIQGEKEENSIFFLQTVTKSKLRKLVLLWTYMHVYFPGRAELQPVLFEGFVAYQTFR